MARRTGALTQVRISPGQAGPIERPKHARLTLLVDRAQATAPFMADLVLSVGWFGKTPKVYIRTSLDKMISPKFQDQMLENWEASEIHTLEARHFPTLSMPVTLAQLML